MADKFKKGQVQVGDFQAALVKLIPRSSLSEDLLKRTMELFDTPTISMQDLDRIFGKKKMTEKDRKHWI